jgi:hypothetical protein
VSLNDRLSLKDGAALRAYGVCFNGKSDSMKLCAMSVVSLVTEILALAQPPPRWSKNER